MFLRRLVPTTLIAVIAMGTAACGTSREAPIPAPEPDDVAQPTPIPVDVPRVMGYHAYWTNDAWEAYPYDVLDAVLFFEIEVGADGGLSNRHGWPDRWLPMQRRAETEGTSVIPVVSLMNTEAFEAVFTTQSAQERLQQEILSLFVDNPGMAGVQLDFEIFHSVPEGVRTAVTRFVQDLEAAMDASSPGKSLSMFLLAYDNADVFDEAALAAAIEKRDPRKAGELRTRADQAAASFVRLFWNRDGGWLHDCLLPGAGGAWTPSGTSTSSWRPCSRRCSVSSPASPPSAI